MVFVPHAHNWGHKCITKKEVEEATAKAIRKEIEHQRTLEAKAWVKKGKKSAKKKKAKCSGNGSIKKIRRKMKVILNKCYGGFSLSEKAHRLYAKKKGWPFGVYRDRYGMEYYRTDGKTSGEPGEKDYFWLGEDDRDDPVLVEVVEELGEEANGSCAELKVVDIPDDMDYVVDDYDGMETLRPKTLTW